jgi:hypothetical protein
MGETRLRPAMARQDDPRRDPGGGRASVVHAGGVRARHRLRQRRDRRLAGDGGLRRDGIDFSAAALARARAEHRDVSRVAFEEVDICERVPSGAPFGAVLDRGCLQGMSAAAKPKYVRHLAAAAEPRARFLLLHGLLPHTTIEHTTREVQALFEATFDVVRIAGTEMARDAATSRVMKGVASG